MRNARPGQDEFRKWETSFTLSPDGGKRFGGLPEANIGNQLAVVLDNQIRQRGHDSKQDRAIRAASRTWAASRKPSDLALVSAVRLAAGRHQYLEERSVGPSLGADSIHAGIMAGLAGLMAVIVVMLVYYKRAASTRCWR